MAGDGEGSMTAKKLAERALEIGQTQSLCGDDFKAFRTLVEALGLIAKYGNTIPLERSTT